MKDPDPMRRPRACERTVGTGNNSSHTCDTAPEVLLSGLDAYDSEERWHATDRFFSPRTLALGTSKRQFGQ